MTSRATRDRPVVITITADRNLHLRRMLDALARCRPAPGAVVVVDMGTTGGVEHVADEAAIDVDVVVTCDRDAGELPLARARNLGAAAVEGDRVVFLDVDCLASVDLVAAYGAAPTGTVQCGPVRYLRPGWDLPEAPTDDHRLRALSREHRDRAGPADLVLDRRHHLLWTLSVGFDRRTFDRLGGFDERFVGYGAEDTDLGRTAASLNVPMAWLPTGTAFHQWHPTSDPPVGHLDGIVSNARRYHRKWGEWPMTSWLQAFADLRLVHWEPERGQLELVESEPTGPG